MHSTACRQVESTSLEKTKRYKNNAVVHACNDDGMNCIQILIVDKLTIAAGLAWLS